MEQALVFASIVLGVAIASELNNLHKLLQSDKVRWHWAQALYALLTLVAIMSFWWMIAKRSSGDEITLAQFLPVMWVMVIFNLMASAALPDTIAEEGLNMADYYQDRRRYLWGLYLLASLPLAGSWIVHSVRTAEGLGRFAAMAGPELFGVAVLVFLFLVRSWWLVGLGFAAYGLLAGGWLFRAL
ncbi:MAG: hypothetical protein AAF251_16835 [Pseudomonadota bacterium]